MPELFIYLIFSHCLYLVVSRWLSMYAQINCSLKYSVCVFFFFFFFCHLFLSFYFMIIIIIQYMWMWVVINKFLNCRIHFFSARIYLLLWAKRQCKCCAKREILLTVYGHLNAVVVVSVGVVTVNAAVDIVTIYKYIYIFAHSIAILWRWALIFRPTKGSKKNEEDNNNSGKYYSVVAHKHTHTHQIFTIRIWRDREKSS